MSKNQISKVLTFKPLSVSLHNGEYSVCITGADDYSPIIVTAEDKSFSIPFSRFSEYFQLEDPQAIIDRLSYFQEMTYEEFQDYFESNEEQAAPIVAINLCTQPNKPWYRDGIPVIVHTMARTSYCKDRHERIVAMFYDLVCEDGMPVSCIIEEGFNTCVYDALRVYEEAHSIKEDEISRIKLIASSGNELAINVKRYDLEYLIRRATENKSWNRRKKLNGLLELLNSECDDQRKLQ